MVRVRVPRREDFSIADTEHGEPERSPADSRNPGISAPVSIPNISRPSGFKRGSSNGGSRLRSGISPRRSTVAVTAAGLGSGDSYSSTSKGSTPRTTSRGTSRGTSGFGALKKLTMTRNREQNITTSLLEKEESSKATGTHQPLAPGEYAQLGRASDGITKDNSEMYRERFHNRLKEVMLKPNPLVLKRQEAIKRKREEMKKLQKMKNQKPNSRRDQPTTALDADDLINKKKKSSRAKSRNPVPPCDSPPIIMDVENVYTSTDVEYTTEGSSYYVTDLEKSSIGAENSKIEPAKNAEKAQPTYTAPLGVNLPKSRAEAGKKRSERQMIPPRAKSKGRGQDAKAGDDRYGHDSSHPKYSRYYADPLESAESSDTYYSEYTNEYDDSSAYSDTGSLQQGYAPRRDGQITGGRALSPDDEPEVYIVKQRFGVFSFLFGLIQIIILTCMMVECGVAPMFRPVINLMFGPYPDVLSYWGAKNAYLIIKGGEWWRIFTPIMLHTGVIHIIVNVGIQMDQGALFEKEWGSLHWILIYIVSGALGTVMSCIFMPDTISVGSSGAVCGLFGAKLAEILCRACETTDTKQRMISYKVRSGQCQETTCCVLIVSMFSFIPHVDWACHLGGFMGGLFMGFALFSPRCYYCVCAVVFAILGWAMTVFMFAYGLTYMYNQVEPNESLGNYCEYFIETTGLENYECKCETSEFLSNYGWGSFFTYNNGTSASDDVYGIDDAYNVTDY